MKSTSAILTALLLVPLASLHAADARKFSAKESDPRLRAEGKGWGLDKAKITDPSRPRVLLIGDSIVGGYHMKEMNVPVNDFYSLLVGRLELAKTDQFHWTAPAYRILAEAATRSICQALESKP